jgi:signal transduction histidine kinase
MPKPYGLTHKINRAFLLQAFLISVAAVLGVYFAKIAIEEILIKQAILSESEYFWENYDRNKQFPLPDTKNLTGYFNRNRLPPIMLTDTPSSPGYYDYKSEENHYVLHLSKRGPDTLYLVYYRGQVDALILYYGIFPLFTVLLILYLSLWLTYRFSHRAISPIVWLAKQINNIDFSKPEFSSVKTKHLMTDEDNEIQELSNAIVQLGKRLDSYITRERNFTRDASHELRSPLTVINLAADLLLSEQELSKPAKNSVHRIKRAITDMEELTEVFLLLARENERGLSKDRILLNGLIQEEIERVQLINKSKQLAIRYSAENKLTVMGSDKVLSVLLGNLLRNAILYTENGTVDILISQQSIHIRDSGKGIPREQIDQMFQPYQRGNNSMAAGHGIGLSIVKRLSDRFNWPIHVESNTGKGTDFQVTFPDAEQAPI